MHRHAEIGGRVFRAFLVTLALVVFQIVFAVFTRSLSLWADTAHVGSDLIAMGIVIVTQFTAHQSHKCGCDNQADYHTIELEATAANGIILILVGGVLLSQAIGRLMDPSRVSGIILVAGIIGLMVNLITLLLLSGEREHLTVQSAIAHVAFDFLASMGVIVAGVAITLTGAKLIDPIISLFITGFIVSWGVRIIWLAATAHTQQDNRVDS